MSYPYKPIEKWDVHTHTTFSPETYADLARFSHYTDFVRVKAHDVNPCCAQIVNHNGEVQRVIEHNAYDGQARVDECNHHHVNMQVLSPTPMMIPDYVDNASDALEICKILNNDNLATVEKFPDRFTAIAALPMMYPDLAIKEMERVHKLGMRGIEINSNINGHDLDKALFFPIFERASELNMGVFLHPWGGFMSPVEERLQKRMNAHKNWRPWLIGMGTETALAFDALRCGSVHERLPKLRVLYAHGGGTFPALLGRLEHGSYCRPDLFEQSSALDAFQTIKDCGVYTDTLTHNPWGLKMLVDMLGVNRIAMGSDYPYPLGEIDPFDRESHLDPKGNKCPYDRTKGIYPGYTIEHLPSVQNDMDTSWQNFNWLPRENANGHRDLPIMSNVDKQRILSGTAKEWLGYED